MQQQQQQQKQKQQQQYFVAIIQRLPCRNSVADLHFTAELNAASSFCF
jgi:hypothetical protein